MIPATNGHRRWLSRPGLLPWRPGRPRLSLVGAQGKQAALRGPMTLYKTPLSASASPVDGNDCSRPPDPSANQRPTGLNFKPRTSRTLRRGRYQSSRDWTMTVTMMSTRQDICTIQTSTASRGPKKKRMRKTLLRKRRVRRRKRG